MNDAEIQAEIAKQFVDLVGNQIQRFPYRGAVVLRCLEVLSPKPPAYRGSACVMLVRPGNYWNRLGKQYEAVRRT